MATGTLELCHGTDSNTIGSELMRWRWGTGPCHHPRPRHAAEDEAATPQAACVHRVAEAPPRRRRPSQQSPGYDDELRRHFNCLRPVRPSRTHEPFPRDGAVRMPSLSVLVRTGFCLLFRFAIKWWMWCRVEKVRHVLTHRRLMDLNTYSSTAAGAVSAHHKKWCVLYNVLYDSFSVIGGSVFPMEVIFSDPSDLHWILVKESFSDDTKFGTYYYFWIKQIVYLIVVYIFSSTN
jgi:hypothetical protein